MKIAVIGAGIAGLGAAWKLSQALHASSETIALFEQADWIGGHSHTVDVTLDGITHGVDTGFLVFNRKTYPTLIELFARLEVPVAETDMSFSVSVETAGRRIEWAGTNLNSVFAQRRNVASPRFIGMLRDIVRFNEEATALALANPTDGETLGAFLDRRRFSQALRDWYLLPMAGAIWSCPTAQMLAFPMSAFARFCHNHGLLQVNNRPKWMTVRGGSREYVRRLLADTHGVSVRGGVRRIARQGAGVQVALHDGTQETFDYAIVATHTDEAMELLDAPTQAERAVLGSIAYQRNRAVLHTDASVLPRARRAWSSWNYFSRDARESNVAVNYLINMLQPVPFKSPVIVSLNPVQPIDPASVVGTYDYAHPVFDRAATAAQERLPSIQGVNRTRYAGAWAGYGFHEDGVKAGFAAAEGVLASIRAAAPSDQLRAA